VAAFQKHLEALQRYPAGEAGWYAAAGIALTMSGDAAAALRVLGEARTRFPTPGNQVIHAGVLHAAGADAKAARILDEVAGRFPEHPLVLTARASLAAASGEYDRAHAIAARAARGASARAPRFPHDAAVPNGLWLQAALDAVRGRVGEAADHLRELRDAMVARGDIAGALEVEAAIGQLRHLAGAPGPTAEVDAFLGRHPLDSLDVLDRPYLPLALFYAETDERPRRARALLAAYEREVPRAFRGPDQWLLHRVRAVVHRAQGNPTAALAELRQAARLPALGVRMSDDPFIRVGDHPELARVHEAAGAADSAIAVYERYLAVRSLARTGADARELGAALERLGVLYEQRGDRARAAARYRRVAALWGEGDAALRRRAMAAGRQAAVLGGPAAR
jgi:tetratricopeptide (TPR) repeat protein